MVQFVGPPCIFHAHTVQVRRADDGFRAFALSSSCKCCGADVTTYHVVNSAVMLLLRLLLLDCVKLISDRSVSLDVRELH